MNNKDLENKSEIKDLGIIVDENLSFSNYIVDKGNKAKQIIGIIGRAMVWLYKHNFNLLYKSLVWHHPEYENAVWSLFLKSGMTSIEKFQRWATRYIPDIKILQYQEWLDALDLPTFST